MAEPTRHGVSDALAEEIRHIETVQLRHLPFNIKHVPEQDRPLVERVFQALFYTGLKWQDGSTRSRSTLENHGDYYMATVRLRADAELDMTELLSVWDVAPLQIDSIAMAPAYIKRVGKYYLSVTVTMRSGKVPPSARFIMHQKRVKHLKLSRRALARWRESLSSNGTLAVAKQAKMREDARQAEHAQADSGSVNANRKPWMAIERPKDRQMAHRVVDALFAMSANPTDDRFWRSLAVEDAAPGYNDRIVVRWALPEGDVLDALFAHSLMLAFPDEMDHITVGLNGVGSERRLAISVVLYASHIDLVDVAAVDIVNLYSQQGNDQTQGGTTFGGRYHGPSIDTDSSRSDPIEIARRLSEDGRGVKRVLDAGNDETDSPRPAKVRRVTPNPKLGTPTRLMRREIERQDQIAYRRQNEGRGNASLWTRLSRLGDQFF